jgi:hypothetical protein
MGVETAYAADNNRPDHVLELLTSTRVEVLVSNTFCTISEGMIASHTTDFPLLSILQPYQSVIPFRAIPFRLHVFQHFGPFRHHVHPHDVSCFCFESDELIVPSVRYWFLPRYINTLASYRHLLTAHFLVVLVLWRPKNFGRHFLDIHVKCK